HLHLTTIMCLILHISISFLFLFNYPPNTEIYTLSLHDALPICIYLNNEKISFILSICELICKYVKVWSHCSFPINKRLCSTLYKAAFIRASKVTYHIKIH